MTATAQQALTGTIKGVETFEAGTYPKERPTDIGTFTDAHLDAIERNFQTLSAGDRPIHRVPVVVTHDAVHAHGWVESARRNPRTGILETDWAEVSRALEEAREAGKLRKVSAEIKQDFTDNDGTVYPGPYLYRVAVIGADVPKVKGLADIPPAKFADAQPAQAVSRTLKFADSTGVPAMDIAAAAAFFAEQGIDTTKWETYPPECQADLIAIYTWAQDDSADAGTDTTMLSDGATGGPTPKKVVTTQHFSDRVARRNIERAEAAALRRIADAEAKAKKAAENRETQDRVSMVMKFCDDMTEKAHKMTPAENDGNAYGSLRSRLIRKAKIAQAVQRFSDGANEQPSELELDMKEIETRPAQKFSERVAQPAGGATNYLDEIKKRTQEKYARKESPIPLAERLGMRRPAGMR